MDSVVFLNTFEFIHSKKRNRLTSDRSNDLVYVFSGLRLAENSQKQRDPTSWFIEEDSEDEFSSEED